MKSKTKKKPQRQPPLPLNPPKSKTKRGRPARTSKAEKMRRAVALRDCIRLAGLSYDRACGYFNCSKRTLGYWLRAAYCIPDSVIDAMTAIPSAKQLSIPETFTEAGEQHGH